MIANTRHLYAHAMNDRLTLLLTFLFLACTSCRAQIPHITESHIAANVPSTNDFRPFLIRDLTAYLKPTLGEKLTVEYELLRNEPTQSGVAYPKFYLWLRATNAEKTVIAGAVRVAAVDKKQFYVTNFVPLPEIISHPDSLMRIFPQALIEKIHTKAMTTEMPNKETAIPACQQTRP